jgi:hypothetical protein
MAWPAPRAEEEQFRPLYARLLGLRFVNPGGVLCFLFFEGAAALAALLALAELVRWWAVLILPAAVAVMVKVNDLVAESVVRAAARVPEQERERFRRQMQPVVGRVRVEWAGTVVPGVVVTPATDSGPGAPPEPPQITATPAGEPRSTDPDGAPGQRLRPAVEPGEPGL